MKKRMLIISLLLLINIVVGSLLVAYIYYKKEPAIHNRLDRYRQSRREERVWSKLMEKRCDIESLPHLKDAPDTWYTKYHVVAHGGGAIDGKINTNSKEAWSASYNRGIRLFDVDINRTSDGFYVLRHSWDDNLEQTKQTIITTTTTMVDWVGYDRYVLDEMQIPVLNDFVSLPIFRRYTPQTITDMFEFLNSHEDVNVVADFKLYNEFDIVYSYIFDYCQKHNMQFILERLIISTANIKQVNAIREINPKAQLTFRVYEYPNNFSEALKLCVENEIHVCMLAQKFVKPEVVKMFTDKGIRVFVTLVNYESDMEYYQSIGCSGCVSDYMYEWN